MQLDMYAEYHRMAEDIADLRGRLGTIRATAESADELVHATTGGAGELIDLRLDPRIYRNADSAALARTITDTIHRAAQDAQRQGLAIAARYLPADATQDNIDLPFDLARGVLENRGARRDS